MSAPIPMTPHCGGSNGDNLGEASCTVTVANTSSIELPMLTRSNYHDWSLVMQVSLEALGLWGAVESDKVERHDNRLAFATILCGVPLEMKSGLTVKNTTKEAWVANKLEWVGDTYVKEANVQKLLKEFEAFTHVDGESVDDLMLRINDIIGKLRELGETMEDKHVVRKILLVMPKKYDQIIVCIEMFSDLNTMKIEELIGKLRAVEDHVNDNEIAEAGVATRRLLLTEGQWEAHRRIGKDHTHNGEARRACHGSDEKGSGSNNSHGKDDEDTNNTC
jgi:hypothetical protein